MRHLKWTALSVTLVNTLGWAGIPMTQELECPIGGQKFKYEATATSSSWGARPDGKPYGSWYFPMPLPVCPDNGLVLFAEFSPEKIKQLEPLVASSEYQAMVKADTPYYRAYWLQQKLDANDENLPWTLLQASWEADTKPELKARYQQEFVDLAAKRPRPEADTDLMRWASLQARRVNALRELGRYDAALAGLETLPRASFEVPAGAPDSRETRARRGLLAYLDELKKLLARRDASAEPLDAIPAREAARFCMRSPDLSKPEVKAVCESAEVIRWKENYERQAR